MLKSKFLSLLATLDPGEMEGFRQFLDSPFFNSREQPRQFFAALYEEYPGWKPLWEKYKHPDLILNQEERRQLQDFLSKESLDQKMFPGEAFNDARIRRMMSDCHRLLEEYLFQIAMRENPTRREELSELMLLQRHFARGEFDFISRRMSKAERNLLAREFRDMNFYRFGFELAELKNSWLIRSSGRKDAFLEMSKNLHTYYVFSFLKFYAAMLTRERVKGSLYEYPLLEELSEMVEKGYGSEAPLMLAYYHILQIERDRHPWEHYPQLLELISDKKEELPHDELRQIYSLMLNFLVRESRKPGKRYHAEMLRLFKEMLSEGMVYIKGKLSPRIFNQVVQTGCLAGDYTWVEEFIFSHSERIVGAEGREIVELAFLVLLFYQGNHERVYRGLDRIRFTTPSLQVQKRCLKLKSCFEMNKSEEFFRALDALRHFLREKSELGEGSLRLYQEFCTWAGRLGRNRFNHAQARSLSPEMLQALEAASTYDKFWLLEKAKLG